MHGVAVTPTLQARKETEPTVYRIELDDEVRFWVAARTAIRAIELARKHEPHLFAGSVTLQVTPRADRSATFLDDDDGGMKTIRSIMRGPQRYERVLACSEWP
jgi:hypothetical protein